MNIIREVGDACELLKQGNIIAYPTEAVYGLGCDPFNQKAVESLLALKQRSIDKGLILLISDWAQLTPLIANVTDAMLEPVRNSWPGAVTWIFPKSTIIPDWLSGAHDGIAIRMTAHVLARKLCAAYPIVSTSANIHGHQPAIDLAGLTSQFPVGIDGALIGDLGGLSQPSAIFDLCSGKRLR